jgi:hypothetical protein
MTKQFQSTPVQKDASTRQPQHDSKDDQELAQEQLDEMRETQTVRRRSQRTQVDKDGGEESVHGRTQKGTVDDR